MKTYSAVYVEDGGLLRMWFEAGDAEKARAFAARCGAGLEGEAARPEAGNPAIPEAYDEETARHILGNISRSTLYRDLAVGRLDRVPDTRKVLVTRESIERRCRLRRRN